MENRTSTCLMYNSYHDKNNYHFIEPCFLSVGLSMRHHARFTENRASFFFSQDSKETCLS